MTKKSDGAQPKGLTERLQAALADESAWWQAPMLVVLGGSALLILYLLGTQRTEFIYALF